MLRPLAVAALAVSVAHPAPAPKEAAPAYFPIREGDTRVYETRVGDRAQGGYTEVVTRVEKKGGAVHVTYAREYAGGTASLVNTIAVSSEGLFYVTSNGELDKRIPFLKLPAREGTSWEVAGLGRYTVMKEEEVEVPAGKFRAIRVELVLEGRTTTLWFAPKLGQVKTVLPGGRVEVLKEFKPGK